MRLIIAEVKTCEKCPYFREDWNHPQDSDYACGCPDRKNDKETFCQFDIFCSQGRYETEIFAFCPLPKVDKENHRAD